MIGTATVRMCSILKLGNNYLYVCSPMARWAKVLLYVSNLERVFDTT